MTDCAADNCISVRDADRLLSAHDGDMALLFLWMRRHASSDLFKQLGIVFLHVAEQLWLAEREREIGIALHQRKHV